MTALEKPFAGLAYVLAHLGKLSALRPIHTLIITSLLASVAYLSIVNQYISEGLLNYDDPASNLVSYFHSGRSSDSWTQVSDVSKINANAELFNVIPFQFKRAGEYQVPELENAYADSADSLIKFFITKDTETAENEHSFDHLVAKDGSVWKYRNYHTKLSKYSDYVVKVYKKVMNLIQGAETFDIAIVTLAYIAMYYTFISLFLEMRKVGSKFWLGFSTLVSSFFAFLFALDITAKYLNLSIPVLSLTEGVPFFVATIGFKHKVLLTQKVLQKYSNKEYLNKGAPNVVYHALKDQGAPLLRDHILVICAFLGTGYFASHLEGLHNFSIFAALVLFFDIFTTFTVLSAVLSLKLEINIISRATNLKQALQEDGLDQQSVDSILKSNPISNGQSFQDTTNNSLVTAAKIGGLAVFFGFHFFGLGSAWLSDLNSNIEYNDNFTLADSILKNVSLGSKGTLVTIYPARFFLPSGTSVQIEEALLSVIGHVSSAIRDKYISKFVLLILAISASINIYLLNAARIHTTNYEENVELNSTKTHKKAKSVSIPKPEAKITEIDGTTETSKLSEIVSSAESENESSRPFEDVVEIFKNGQIKSLYNDEIVSLVTKGKVPLYALEKQLSDTTRAVLVRRKAIAKLANAPVLETNKLPYLAYDYDRVFGACCENVIGFMPLPVGIAGPLIIDGKPHHIPMATTEGCLVASATRGCKAINLGGGITTVLTKDGMTRGPVVQFPSLARAGACKIWIDSEEGSNLIKKAFNSTSRFARLQSLQTALAGDLLFIRFRTTTGDAMGMNMISKGVEFALKQMTEEFGWDDMQIISVSGNYCSDKKPAAINWIEGRGKSVVAEANIPKDQVEKILKTTVKALVELNISKNLIGSAMAGSIGGFNAHAANLLTAVYLALGQDPAQNVESSNCITIMKERDNGDLNISVSMPSIEVGTIGGGTILDPQNSMLELLGVKGPAEVPGDNARQLAKIIASIVLAGELSLCSALAAGHLVQSHMTHNRAGAGPAKK